MTALARGDEQRILRFIAEGDSFGGEHPFEGEFLTQLGKLVPAQWIGFGTGLNRDPAAPNYFGGFSRPGDEHVFDHVDWSEALPVVQAETHPFLYLDHNFGAAKISDFLNRRELRRTHVYSIVLEPAGLEHVLVLRLPTATEMYFIFDRSGHDFAERDREVLLTLSPHLVRIHEAAEMRRRLQTALALRETTRAVVVLLEQLTTREREILGLVAEGHTNGEIAARLWISPGTVRKHLDNIYAKLGVHTRGAAAAFLRT
jgi:DNA-binding CsgD family transcriptional regulator